VDSGFLIIFISIGILTFINIVNNYPCKLREKQNKVDRECRDLKWCWKEVLLHRCGRDLVLCVQFGVI
jgi:hypothetical protein